MELDTYGIAFVCMTYKMTAIWNNKKRLPTYVTGIKKGTLYVNWARKEVKGRYTCQGKTVDGYMFLATATLIIKRNNYNSVSL